MSRTRLTLLAGVSGLALILAGCEEGGGLTSRPDGEAGASVERPAAARLIERDVEAPEVFQKTETGLWDGRPSLGGVWVAHPEVKDPERVIIRNEANGQFVIGALFRRERENPGPSLQVSSDAAAALGLIAGQPTVLNVTALRREEEKAPEPAPVAAAAPAEAETIESPEAIAAAPLSPAPADGAASAAEGETVAAEAEPRRRWSPFRRAETGADTGDETGEATGADDAGAAIATAPLDAAPATAAAPRAAAAASEPAAATPPEATAEAAPKERRNPFRRKPAEPASALVAEATTEVAAAGTEIRSERPAPVRTAAPAAAAPQKPAAAAGRSFVQIGIFSVEGNASRAAEIMRKNGVVPTVTESSSQGKTYWRVVVGPASGATDRASLLRKVQNLGFTDAFAVER